jgi:solute carrier family 30 (zinc transporter), member 2
MLSSVGVIVAATIIYIWPTMTVVDPICTYIFSVIICFTTTPIFTDCIRVMMEGSPKEIDIEELLQDIAEVKGVEDIHDFHLWSISSGKFALSCHLMSD